MAFSVKNAIFRPYFELEAIVRQSVEASHEVSCAYFGNTGRNRGYFLLQFFFAVHPNGHPRGICFKTAGLPFWMIFLGHPEPNLSCTFFSQPKCLNLKMCGF